MAHNPSPLTASNIKYLLVIYELEHDGRGVRCTDVADALHVTKPSVHRTMVLLNELHLIRKNKYGAIFFTETGKKISARYAKCFEVLYASFDNLLPNDSDIKSVVCAVIAQLPLEEVEQMCANMM